MYLVHNYGECPMRTESLPRPLDLLAAHALVREPTEDLGILTVSRGVLGRLTDKLP
jgi:hypothetical protein